MPISDFFFLYSVSGRKAVLSFFVYNFYCLLILSIFVLLKCLDLQFGI